MRKSSNSVLALLEHFEDGLLWEERHDRRLRIGGVPARLGDAFSRLLADLADDDQTTLRGEVGGRVAESGFVNDCKTRMWAVSDMLLVIFKQEAANAAYAEEFDDFTDLRGRLQGHPVDPRRDAPVNRRRTFIEGERYNTLSVALVLPWPARVLRRGPGVVEDGGQCMVKSVDVDFIR